MKKLILIIGPNGVGKSTTAEILLTKLEKSAYIDADWCRAINPFLLTEATSEAVTSNLYHFFKNYLLCEDIETILFPYAFHGDRRAAEDGRDRTRIERGMRNTFHFYDEYTYPKIDTTEMTPEKAAESIMELIF